MKSAVPDFIIYLKVPRYIGMKVEFVLVLCTFFFFFSGVKSHPICGIDSDRLNLLLKKLKIAESGFFPAPLYRLSCAPFCLTNGTTTSNKTALSLMTRPFQSGVTH